MRSEYLAATLSLEKSEGIQSDRISHGIGLHNQRELIFSKRNKK